MSTYEAEVEAELNRKINKVPVTVMIDEDYQHSAQDFIDTAVGEKYRKYLSMLIQDRHEDR